MTHYFLDTSALVKRYVNEMGTAWVHLLHDPQAGHTRWLVQMTAVEATAAVFRRARAGHLSLADAQHIRTRFRADLMTDYRIIDVTPLLIERAMDLAEQFALRGYDAVQLAAADLVNTQFVSLRHPPITFVSADNDLNTAAQRLGLSVEDPNMH